MSDDDSFSWVSFRSWKSFRDHFKSCLRNYPFIQLFFLCTFSNNIFPHFKCRGPRAKKNEIATQILFLNIGHFTFSCVSKFQQYLVRKFVLWNLYLAWPHPRTRSSSGYKAQEFCLSDKSSFCQHKRKGGDSISRDVFSQKALTHSRPMHAVGTYKYTHIFSPIFLT